MGLADSRGIPRAPRYSGAVCGLSHDFAYGALTLCGNVFQRLPLSFHNPTGDGPTTPKRAPNGTPPVWALARSLAATGAIVFTFSSCGYLDVSVPRVRPTCSGDGSRLPPGFPIRTSADDYGYLPLSAAFRSLSRPSSPPRATGIPRAPLFTFFLPSDCRSGDVAQPAPGGAAWTTFALRLFRSILSD